MAAQALIDAYKRAQLDVIKRIKRRDAYSTVSEYERQLLAEIDGILRSLGVDTAKWIREAVPAAYQSAALETYHQLSMTPTAGASFAGVNQAAVKVIIDNATGRASDALQAIGRRLNDQVRDAALRAAELKLTSNQTIRAMQRELQRELADQGNALGIPDSRGRIQPVDAYANMTARTVTREATNTATMSTAHELGSHLFKMSSHFPTCKICAPRQGRVYRDIDFPEGDERNRFPYISQAFPGWPEFRTVHPNCRHVVSAVGWSALSRETQERYLADADKPFDADPRSEKEIKAYDLGQAENRMMREDRKQWERMRARLGDDAPKSFGAFRRIKYADGGVRRAFYETDENGHEVLRCGKAGNGKTWGVLQAKYRAMGYYDAAVANEPEITDVVKGVARSVGMDPVGLEFRIKSRESFLRKVEANYSPDGNQYEVRDIIRYTFTAPPDTLAEKTLGAIETFGGMGYNTSVIKNSWDRADNPYKGINTTITTPSGQKFEMQYHTPESFDLKNGTLHKLYEKQRLIEDETSPEYIRLKDQMLELSRKLTRPTGIEGVRNR